MCLRARTSLLVLASLTLTACEDADPPGQGPELAPWNAHLPEELRDGKWSETPTGSRAPRLTQEQRRQIEALQAIGYADAVRLAPDLERVTIHDRERAQAGYNFFTSGHATEAYLTDMEGEVLHTWSHAYDGLWPDLDVPADAAGRGKWRRAYLLPGGEILAIHEGIGLIKLDRASRLLWEYPGRTHHDLHLLEDGTIWTLGREARLIPRIDPEVPCMDDFLVELSPSGQERRRISVLECLENGRASELLARMPSSMELFHTNSIEVLDGCIAERHEAFAAGNILISLRHLDAIAVIDPRSERAVWWMVGDFAAQHDPQMLENGNLLLFDNRGRAQASSVYEIDPVSREIVWSYRGSEKEPFYSRTCGTSYRLRNGNTLITESDGGRSFEVDTQGEIVWEFFNPFRGGEDMRYIACLYDLVRIEPQDVADWLPLASGGQ